MTDPGPGWWTGPPPPPPPPPGRSRSSVPLVLVLALVAGAGVVIGVVLGGGDSDPSPPDPATDREEMIDGLSTGLYENFGGTLNHDEADCAARSVVNKVGEDRLLDLGLGPSNPYDVFSVTELTLEEQGDVVGGVVQCISDDRLVGYLASTYSAGGELTFEQAECIAERQVELLGPDRMRDLTVEANFQPGESVASLADPDEQGGLEAIDRECTAG